MNEIIESLTVALNLVKEHKHKAVESMLFDTAIMFLNQEYALLDVINKLESELYSVEG